MSNTEAVEIVGRQRVNAAECVYRNNYIASPEELKALGFTTDPSKEYIREAVLETLAAVWMELIKEVQYGN